METMKAIAEIHTNKSPDGAGPAADSASPVITQPPGDADGLANMEDINLNADENVPVDTKAEDNIDGIELKDMLNTSRDDSGISGDLAATDLGGQSEDDLDLINHYGNIKPAAETEPEQICDTHNSRTHIEEVAEVHKTPSEIVGDTNSEHSKSESGNAVDDDDQIKSGGDTVDGRVDEVISGGDAVDGKVDEVISGGDNTEEQLNQTDKPNTNTANANPLDAIHENATPRKAEEVASIASEGSEVTNSTTGSAQRPASLDIDVSLDGISTCSFDPEADVPEVRSTGDGRVDQVSLVDVKVEVKDEMALLSKSIAEVQQEDGKLFEAKVKYQRELREARLKLYRMYKTYRQAIEKTKPYYVAKELEKEMKAELDQTERDADRAKLNFEAAKETEAIAMEAMSNTKAEHGSIGSQGGEGREALENWNQATARVLETSKLRAEIEDRLRRKEEQFLQAERSANALFLDLRKFIEKAWPYYAMKDQYTRTLERTRKEIRESGQRLAAAKENYQETFSRLNLVATEIHQRKTINDRQSGLGANDNFSQFEEVHDIDTVLASLESKAENLSACLDGLDDDDEGDIEAELTIMPKSKSLFSIGRSNTRESLDEILEPKKILGEKGRRKTLAQLTF